jgi:uncharacterized protein (DUF2236 family)
MEGYFTDESMLRRVHRERALALAGPRALLMQAAHPLALAGVFAHSTGFRDEPYERLARTAQVMHAIGFGTKEEADQATRRVRAMHRRVRGTLEHEVGPFPAGTPYRADDPKLLMWILYTLVDSGLVVYGTYVGDLDDAEQAAYWSDYRLVGGLFGLRDHEMPESLRDLRDYGRHMLSSGQLVVTDWARRRARELVLEPRVPLHRRPVLDTVNFITIGLLPGPIRRQYRFAPLPPAPVRKALVVGGGEYVKRAVMPFLPERVRLVPSARVG